MALKIFDEETGKEYPITQVETAKSPDFKEIYTTGTSGGGFGPYDLRLNFYDTEIDKKTKNSKEYYIEKRIVKGTVIMSFASAKQLHKWLGKQLERYEKASGHPVYTGEITPSVDGDV